MTLLFKVSGCNIAVNTLQYSLLIFFWEIPAIYSDILTKHKHVTCVQRGENFIVNAGGAIWQINFAV
jgi:hypothetical protein